MSIAGTGFRRGKAKNNPFASADVVGGASITVGAEAGNVIICAIQLKDSNGRDLAQRGHVRAYLSNDANGDTVTATAPNGTIGAGTDGVVMQPIAGKLFELASESDGDIDLSLGESSTGTWYLVIILPNGAHVVSGAITFA